MPTFLANLPRFTAGLLLLLAFLLPWFRVPAGIQENGGNSVIFREAASTAIMKSIGIAIVLCTCGAKLCHTRYRHFSWAAPMSITGCALLACIGIFYPALTTQRCAAVFAHAAWLEAQHLSMVQVTGDALTSQEYEYQSSRPEVYVEEIFPHSFEAIPVPALSSFLDLRLAELTKIVTWLGWSPTFCQFVSLGWFCGLCGSFLLLTSCVRTNDPSCQSAPNVRLAYQILLPFIASGCMLCLLCLAPVVVAGRELAEARSAASAGNFRASLRHLELVTAWVPVLSYDTDIIYQQGWLQQKLGLSSATVSLVTALNEEEEGFDGRACQRYFDVLDSEKAGPNWDEAYRGVLRLAIKDYNSGLLDRASIRLSRLATMDPSCLKANYALQLVDLRSSRKERLENDVARFEAVYKCFESREKSGLIAVAHGRLAEMDFDAGDTARLGEDLRAAAQP
jgi:hypothetical protein